jgi:hypothetical protein
MFVQNVFSELELDTIHRDLNQRLQEQDWNSWELVKKNLENTIVHGKTSGYPNEQGIIKFKFINGAIKDLLRQKIISIDPTVRGYDFKAYYQIWDIGSATGMHSDSSYMFNATFYLNKEWSAEDGGLYVYLDNDEYKVYVPKYNSCAYINQSMIEQHLVTPVTSNAKEKRFTIHCKGAVVK